MDNYKEMLIDIFKNVAKNSLFLSQEMNVVGGRYRNEIGITFNYMSEDDNDQINKLKQLLNNLIKDVKNDRRGDNADSKIGTV